MKTWKGGNNNNNNKYIHETSKEDTKNHLDVP